MTSALHKFVFIKKQKTKKQKQNKKTTPIASDSIIPWAASWEQLQSHLADLLAGWEALQTRLETV